MQTRKEEIKEPDMDVIAYLENPKESTEQTKKSNNNKNTTNS